MHATSCVLATKKFQMGRLEAQQVIQRLLDHLGIKAPTLARELDVLYRRVYDIQSGKTKKVSGDLAKKIVARYPDVSLSWLLTGEGDMLTGATTQTGGHHSVQMRGVSARGNVSVHTASVSDEEQTELATMRAQLRVKDRTIESLLAQIDKLTTALTTR